MAIGPVNDYLVSCFDRSPKGSFTARFDFESRLERWPANVFLFGGTGTMNTSTALNHYGRLLSRLTDIYATGRAFSQTHDTILQSVQERVWGDKALKRCPAWVKDRLHVWDQMLLESLYQKPTPENAVVWVHYLDGKRVSSEEVPSERWPDVVSRHEWSKTGKPFSEETKQ